MHANLRILIRLEESVTSGMVFARGAKKRERGGEREREGGREKEENKGRYTQRDRENGERGSGGKERSEKQSIFERQMSAGT